MIRAIIIPTHESNLRAKNNGVLPISNQLRKDIIETTIKEACSDEEDKEWICGYYDILDNPKVNEGIGAATRDIVKTLRLKYD